MQEDAQRLFQLYRSQGLTCAGGEWKALSR
jgi:hypothetical protein